MVASHCVNEHPNVGTRRPRNNCRSLIIAYRTHMSGYIFNGKNVCTRERIFVAKTVAQIVCHHSNMKYPCQMRETKDDRHDKPPKHCI